MGNHTLAFDEGDRINDTTLAFVTNIGLDWKSMPGTQTSLFSGKLSRKYLTRLNGSPRIKTLACFTPPLVMMTKKGVN
jgi:hypothetical protein